MLWPELSLYLIGADRVSTFAADPPALASFLEAESQRLTWAWRGGAPTHDIAAAIESLRFSLGEVLDSGGLYAAAILVIEADCRLSMATEGSANTAFDLAERALSLLTGSEVDPTEALESSSEAALIASVALKAMSLNSECLDYMQYVRRAARMSDLAAIPLLRQSVMMSQEFDHHIALLDASPAYRIPRPREYYRTIKRVFEFCLREDRRRLADSLLPELLDSFAAALPWLSISAQVSFFKNLAQYLAMRGDSIRARRVLSAVAIASQQYGLRGSMVQTDAMLRDLEGGEVPLLRTFRVTPA